MAMYQLLILTGCLLGCGEHNYIDSQAEYKQYKPADYPEGIEPELSPYYKLFNKLNIKGLGKEVTSIPSKFGKLKGRTVGLCWYGDDWQYIEIDRKYWNQADKYERESLMLHELGHCALGREHTTELIKEGEGTGVPKRLMYPTIIGGYLWYQEHRSDYFTELFEGL